MSTTAPGRAWPASRDTAIDEIGSTQDPAQATGLRRRASWPVWGAVAALMIVSSIAHLWALHRNLPLSEIDEPFFVRPAVHIAATGDPNPHWFGHPGSTVIYPLAGLFHVWDVVAHHGPIVTSNPALTARFHSSPTEFYVIGRLWTIALSVGALPLLFLVGRRAFNTRVALMATAVWAVLPLPVHLGRVVRTDSAAVFFGLLALWLCLRLLDEPRARWRVLAGVAVGLAVSSRYFMVALVPVLLAAAVWPKRRSVLAATRSAAIALTAAVASFALTTPYFLLDLRTAFDSLQAESGFDRDPHHLGLSRLGNLRWYLGTAIPEGLTWPLVALAAAGVVIVLWRHRRRQLLLVAFCAIFLAGICASTLHWNRWVIQILPVIVLFAAAAVDAVIGRLAAVSRVPRAPTLVPAALVVVTAVLILHPLAELRATNSHDGGTTSIDAATRRAARNWILAHLRPGSRILADSETLVPDGPHLDVDDRLDARTHTVVDYQHDGYQYVLINARYEGLRRLDVASHPREAAFYQGVACRTRLIAVLPVTPQLIDHDLEVARHGWPIKIYQLDRLPRRVSDYVCTQR